MVSLDQDRVILSSILTMAPGSVSRPVEDMIHPTTVDTTRTTTFLPASRCAAPPAEEPSVTVCEATASTATMDEDEKATKAKKFVIYLIIMYNL